LRTVAVAQLQKRRGVVALIRCRCGSAGSEWSNRICFERAAITIHAHDVLRAIYGQYGRCNSLCRRKYPVASTSTRKILGAVARPVHCVHGYLLRRRRSSNLIRLQLRGLLRQLVLRQQRLLWRLLVRWQRRLLRRKRRRYYCRGTVYRSTWAT